MALVITPAIVLSALRYSETSKIVRLATREHGVQSAIAKGALRPKSRFGGALQVLSEGQAQYLAKEHRELHVLTAFDLAHLHVGPGGGPGTLRHRDRACRGDAAVRPAGSSSRELRSVPRRAACARGGAGGRARRAGVSGALASRERARLRAVARRLRARRPRAPGRRRAAVQHPRGRRALPGVRRATRCDPAPRRRPGRPGGAARSRRGRCRCSTTATGPRTAACSPATSATTWRRARSCRRSTSGCRRPWIAA